MLEVARAAGTGEAPRAVAAAGEVAAKARPIHHHIVDVALVDILAGGLGQVGVAVQPGAAVLVLSAPNLYRRP